MGCIKNIIESLQYKTQRVKCEIWTRAMGYCRPVSNFNKGKQSEFKERKYFTEEKAIKKEK